MLGPDIACHKGTTLTTTTLIHNPCGLLSVWVNFPGRHHWPWAPPPLPPGKLSEMITGSNVIQGLGCWIGCHEVLGSNLTSGMDYLYASGLICKTSVNNTCYHILLSQDCGKVQGGSKKSGWDLKINVKRNKNQTGKLVRRKYKYKKIVHFLRQRKSGTRDLQLWQQRWSTTSRLQIWSPDHWSLLERRCLNSFNGAFRCFWDFFSYVLKGPVISMKSPSLSIWICFICWFST